MKTYEPQRGDSTEMTVARMVELVNESGEPVRAIFAMESPDPTSSLSKLVFRTGPPTPDWTDETEDEYDGRTTGRGSNRALDDSAPVVVTYFIQSAKGGPIKIGRAGDARKRLQTIQTSHHDRLVILATIASDCEDELHKRFAASRLCGEWFTPTQELLDLIAAFVTSEGSTCAT